MVTVNAIYKKLAALAPEQLAESWDNVGFQVGNGTQEVCKVALALTPSLDVIEQAVTKYDLLITHHPLIFKPLKSLTDCSPNGQAIQKMIKSDLSHIAMHTNLDIAIGGVNDVLAEKLNLHDIAPLQTIESLHYEKWIVFVPTSHQEVVREAVSKAGAGMLGDYSDCFWSTLGTGSFRPLDGANPYQGSLHTLEEVEEARLEFLVAPKDFAAVEQALKASHSYEEIAYDRFKEEHLTTVESLGRIGMLPQSYDIATFVRHIEKSLATKVRYSRLKAQKSIKKVAVCGGSGASLLQEAKSHQCDALITGDCKYHDAQWAYENDILLIDAGHFATERPVLSIVEAYLKEHFYQLQIDILQEKDFFVGSNA